MTAIFRFSILHLTKITSNGNQQRTEKFFVDQCNQRVLTNVTFGTANDSTITFNARFRV